jgi:hypothetical protein
MIFAVPGSLQSAEFVLPPRVEIFQTRENDATQLLFVVVAFRRERECECASAPEIHGKLS